MTDKPQAKADSQRILAALIGLHRAFPLEQRIRKEACDDTRETYLAVLLRWIQSAAAPSIHGFDLDTLDELAALDAIFVENDLISCPPFSAMATATKVHFPHETVHACSALDALAMPRMLKSPATVEARCAVSGEPITFTLTQAGELRMEDIDAAVVAFQKVAAMVNRYYFDLAPGIHFVLPQHAHALAQTLKLDEAFAVANSFYAFQRKLLDGAAA